MKKLISFTLFVLLAVALGVFVLLSNKKSHHPLQMKQALVKAAQASGTIRQIGALELGISRQIAMQADGKILMAGLPEVDPIGAKPDDSVLARYAKSGKPDTTFSGDGSVPLGPDQVVEVEPLDDGRTLVAQMFEEDRNFGTGGPNTITCYNSNGSIDTRFGRKGRLQIGKFSNESWIRIKAGPGGSFVIASAAQQSGGGTTVRRYNSKGKLQTTFKTENDLLSLIIQEDNQIITVSRALYLQRITVDGRVDAGFKSVELGIKQFGGVWSGDPVGLAIQHDGKIVMASSGKSDHLGNGRVGFVSRFNPEGTLDKGFADGGTRAFNTLKFEDLENSVAIQSDGRIVVGGSRYQEIPNDDQLDEGNAQFMLVRLNTDGGFDESFSDDGQLAIHVSEVDAQNSGDGSGFVRVVEDGSIYVLGFSNNDMVTALHFDKHGLL